MHRYLFLFPFLFVLSSPAQKTPKKAKNSPPRPCKIVMPVSQPNAPAYALVIQRDGTYRRYPDAWVPEVKEMPECSDAPTTPSSRSGANPVSTGGKIIP
jgi:hypothetical protein